MSAVEGWDVTVPEDGVELLAELRRHGVRPGQRLHIAAAAGDLQAMSTHDGHETSTAVGEPPSTQDDVPDGGGADTVQGLQAPVRFAFAGMLKDGPSDLAARADDYLARSFGRS